MKALRKYQKVALETNLMEFSKRPGFGNIFGMGLGKTVVALKTIDGLRVLDNVRKSLVTAPSRVLSHWAKEHYEWGTDTPVYLIDGDEQERRQKLALFASDVTGIAVISHTMLQWLEQTQVMFDLFAIDESSKFRNWSAKRTKAARRIASRTPRRMALTGTPTPNCPSEIFAQQFMLDRGATLGSAVTRFRERFMYRGGYENREWLMVPEHIPTLTNLVSPWYLRQATLDHLDMPRLVEREVMLDLPPQVLGAYKRFERELFTELDSGQEILALSGAGKYGICRQLASGGVYDDNQAAVHVHDTKIEALRDLLDQTDSPVLVAYWFSHEVERIKQAFPHAEVIRGGTSAKETDAILARWKQGLIKLLVCQAETVSHGVDGLQHGGCCDICWFTLTDNTETWLQFISRIWRQGQTAGTVTVHYLLGNRTIDMFVRKLVQRKDSSQQAFLDAIQEYRSTAA